MELYTPGFIALLIAGLLLTGAIAGVLAGLLGVGGGIVIVPVLYLLFEFLNIPDEVAMHLAVATSLATIIPTSISSARSHNKRGAIDWTMFRQWAPAIALGAVIGGMLSGVLSSTALSLVFGVVAIVVAMNLILSRNWVLGDRLPEHAISRSVLGGIIGVLSALMGIGGGTLSVPFMALFSVPVHRAVGTASAYGLVIALPAVVGFIVSGWTADLRPPYSLGYVSLPAAVVLFSASVLTAPLGSRLAHSLNPDRLRLAFAVFLFISASRMIAASI